MAGESGTNGGCCPDGGAGASRDLKRTIEEVGAMRRIIALAACLVCIATADVLAQDRFNVKTLPAEIRALPWKTMDFDGASALERCRALDLLNDALDEIRDELSADADLMSGYIDEKELGDAFVAHAGADGPAPLTYPEGQKVALAMLRGPMASSVYSTVLEGAGENELRAFANMNLSSTRWKWGEMADRRDRVREMFHFLKAQGKLEDYNAWVPGELERRAAEQKAAMDEKKRVAAEKAKEQSEKAREAARERREQEERDELAKRERAAAEMQQAMAAAQDSQPASTGGTVVVDDDDYGYWYYGGLWNRPRVELYRDPAYRGAAAAATDRRMS